MAILKGKHLTGIIGKVTIKQWRDKTVLQIKSFHPRQTAATKQSAGLFGQSSTLARLIRGYTGPENFYDGAMVNRLVTEVAEAMRQSFHKETKTFSFREDSFHRLQGFEYNMHSPFKNYFWVEPVVHVQGQELTIGLPELKPAVDMRFPQRATGCLIGVKTIEIDLLTRGEGVSRYFQLEIERDEANVPAQEWVVEAKYGCLTVVAFELSYYARAGGFQTFLNSKSCNPSAIIAAVYVPS